MNFCCILLLFAANFRKLKLSVKLYTY